MCWQLQVFRVLHYLLINVIYVDASTCMLTTTVFRIMQCKESTYAAENMDAQTDIFPSNLGCSSMLVIVLMSVQEGALFLLLHRTSTAS